MTETYKMLIAGKLVDSASGQYIEVKNPATAEVIGRVPRAGQEEVSSASESSAEAFETWQSLPAAERGKIMHQMAEALRQNAGELARLITLEEGKPLKESTGEVAGSAGMLDFYAEETRRIFGEVVPPDHKERAVFILKEAVGPAAIIAPWNFPLAAPVRPLAPCLAAGCTAVIKPSSATPLTCLRAAELWHQAGLPSGVINVITGPGEKVGEALILHPLIKKVTVTGSLEAGRRIYEMASKNIKRVGLELGGHCPAIIFADANLDIAADALTFQGFRNAGELCNRVNRIYVEEEIAEELKRRLVDKAEKIVVGNGLEEGVDMGPLLAERFFNKVHGQVIDAKEKGAKILTGGERLREEKYAKGFFYPPTLMADVNHQMRLMQEETFGPVIGIMTFTDEAEAVRLANDTVYGLSAFVFSRDLKRAWEVMRRLEAGSVWINDIHGSYIHCPYGGMKESGLGREQSSKAVEEYLEEKTVYLDLAEENRGGYLMVH